MCIGANGDDLTAKLTVTLQNFGMGMGITKSIAKSRGIDLDTFIFFDQSKQDFIKDFCKFGVIDMLFRITAVTHDVIHMPVYVKFIVKTDIFQHFMEILHIGFPSCQALEKALIICHILFTGDMRRTDDEIKRICFDHRSYLLRDMRLQTDLDAEVDGEIRFFLDFKKDFMIFFHIQCGKLGFDTDVIIIMLGKGEFIDTHFGCDGDIFENRGFSVMADGGMKMAVFHI